MKITTQTDVEDEEIRKEVRIYIGGLDPTRLTVRDLLKRLSDQLGKSVVLKDIHYSSQVSSSSYVQFTAVLVASLTPLVSNDASEANKGVVEQSTYALVHKLFHNVTWKGCKLKVEHAQSHFLERLRNEIREREERICQKTQHQQSQQQNKETAAGSVRRHMKIKRGYGQACWTVDTKPFLVTDWHGFQKTLKHLKRKREICEQKKHQAEGINNEAKNLKVQASVTENKIMKTHENQNVYYNRSIHIRFADKQHVEDISTTKDNSMEKKICDVDNLCQRPEALVSMQEEDEIEVDGSEATSVTESSDGNKSTSSGEKLDCAALEKNAYVWSDDESSSSSNTNRDSDNVPEAVLPRSRSVVQESVVLSKKVDNTDFISSSLLDDSTNYGVYHDIPKHEEDDKPNRMCNAVPVLNLDTSDIDIKQDVEYNLSILSQIFPEIKRHAPALDVVQSKETETLGKANTSQSKAKLGWSTSGQMLRYDPARKESKSEFRLDNTGPSDDERQFSPCNDDNEVDDDELVEMNDGDDESRNSPESSLSTPHYNDPRVIKNKNENNTIHDNKMAVSTSRIDVYEQGKLEEVFRQAREGPKVSIVLPTTDANNTFTFSLPTQEKNANHSSFSFGFELTDDEKNKAQSRVDENQNDTATFATRSLVALLEDKVCSSDKNTSSISDVFTADFNTSNRNLVKRRLAYEFIDDTNANGTSAINQFVQFAYYDALSEGSRILRDLENFRADSNDIENWKQERRRLTMDWKNKRKLAIKQKQGSIR